MNVGDPLRGYNRALRVSLDYCFRYFVLAAGLIVAVGPFFAGLATIGLLFGLFWASVLMFPTAFVANLVFARLFRYRTWRGEPWRRWIAGALGVVLTTGGLVLVGFVEPQPPRFLVHLFGGVDLLVYALGWFILFSNLALLVAWSLPVRKRRVEDLDA